MLPIEFFVSVVGRCALRDLIVEADRKNTGHEDH